MGSHAIPGGWGNIIKSWRQQGLHFRLQNEMLSQKTKLQGLQALIVLPEVLSSTLSNQLVAQNHPYEIQCPLLVFRKNSVCNKSF